MERRKLAIFVIVAIFRMGKEETEANCSDFDNCSNFQNGLRKGEKETSDFHKCSDFQNRVGK